MEVMHTVLVIYPALWWGCIVILAGSQNISVPKYNNSVLRGKDVTLTCYFPFEMQLSTCQWYFTQNEDEERELTNGTRYIWSCSQRPADKNWVPILISFKNATFTDTGKYICEAKTSTETVRGELLLTVHAKPEITVPKTNYTATSGANVTLECAVNVNGETITSVGWKYAFNQRWDQVTKLTKSQNYFWTIQMPSLVISKVTTTDSCFYRCSASTPLVTVEGPDIYLKVQDLPQVNVSKTLFLVTRGEDVVLHCSVNGRGVPIISVIWYIRDQASLISLVNNMQYGWNRKGPDASITISTAIENDAGIYVCEGITEVGSSQGKDIELRVGYKPTVTVREYIYSVGIGSNLILHCSIDGHGSTVQRVEWLKQERSQYRFLQQSSRVFWSISSPSLRIINVQLGDAGQYKFRGMTEFGNTESQQISVMVFSEPSFSIPSGEYRGKSGTNVSLEVNIDVGIQTLLSVQWEKYKEDNQQWYPLQRSSRLLWSNAMPSLVIATVFVEDGGRYRVACRTTYHNVTSSPIALTIYIPVQIKVLEITPMVIHEGERVEIRCRVDGWPEPRIFWRLVNGTKIVASSLENIQGSILVLENVTKLTEGNYTCIAQNNFDLDQSLIYLTVSDLPVNKKDGEVLTGSSSENYVIHAVSVVACVAFIALISLIVVVIFIRRKRFKGRKDKPDSGTRSANGQQQSSPSRNTRSGNGHAEVSVIPLENPTYAQVIRKSNTRIDGSRSTANTDISQYMNINNTYATVQKRPSASNPNSSNCEETESENTQVSRTEELNYAELEFNSDTQDENCKFVIRGSPSTTTYTDVVVFTR